MKTNRIRNRFKKRIAIAMSIGILSLTAGCDSMQQTSQETAPASTSMAGNVIDKLDLSGEQAALVDEVFAKYADRGPGASWFIAAELQESLSDEQKTTWLAELKQERMGRFDRSDGGEREGRGRRFAAADSFFSSLTEDQKTALKAQRERIQNEMKSLMTQRREGSIGDEEVRARVRDLHESAREALAGMLTEEQMAELDARRPRRDGFTGERTRGARGGRFEGARDEMAREAMIQALALTDEQQAQLKQLREARREEFEALREKIEAGELDRHAIREHMEGRREAMQAQFDGVLTEQQQEIMALHRAVLAELRAAEAIERGNVPRVK